MFRTSVSKISGIIVLNYLFSYHATCTMICRKKNDDNMYMPVNVDNIPEYKDPQAHSASEHNISSLPVAKHMPLSLFSGDL